MTSCTIHLSDEWSLDETTRQTCWRPPRNIYVAVVCICMHHWLPSCACLHQMVCLWDQRKTCTGWKSVMHNTYNNHKNISGRTCIRWSACGIKERQLEGHRIWSCEQASTAAKLVYWMQWHREVKSGASYGDVAASSTPQPSGSYCKRRENSLFKCPKWSICLEDCEDSKWVFIGSSFEWCFWGFVFNYIVMRVSQLCDN